MYIACVITTTSIVVVVVVVMLLFLLGRGVFSVLDPCNDYRFLDCARVTIFLAGVASAACPEADPCDRCSTTWLPWINCRRDRVTVLMLVGYFWSFVLESWLECAPSSESGVFRTRKVQMVYAHAHTRARTHVYT